VESKFDKRMVNFITASGPGLTILPEPDQIAICAENDSVRADKAAAESGSAATLFMSRDLSDLLYQQVVEILREEQNFHLEGYKDLCIRRRLAARIRASAVQEPQDYIDLLAEDSREQELLLAALSVHVSQFFRNPSVFQMLDKVILPALLKRTRQDQGKLRIWSVGCAYGEEPYSLACLCQKLLGGTESVSIIATDLSPEALKYARQGCFTAERISQVPAEMVQKFFAAKGHKFELAEKIRQKVQFFRHDILTDKPFYRAELILCRNLLIYFSREQQRHILEKLAQALLPGGYLVLGRAETLAPACRDLFHCVDPAERIYQRVVSDG
jgi:chemotaxis protein methyltransferase CheR